jgi:drug/metabolite transporter (DMT)-like permease
MTSDQRAIGFALGAVACWSTVATAFKIALSNVDTFQLLFYATLTASIVLLVSVLVVHGQQALVNAFKSHWKTTLIAGALNPVLYYVVLFRAYDLLPAQIALSINYSWAIVLSVMAIVFLKQPVRATDLAAAVVCYLGVIVIASQGQFSLDAAISLIGIGLALLSTIVWASYWTLNVIDAREPVIGLSLNFLVALPITAVICWNFSSFSVSALGLLSSGYVGLMEMALGFLCWSAALKLTSNTSRVSNLIFLSPFISLIFIHFVLGEEIFPTTFAGLILIIIGIAGQQYFHQKKHANTTAT